MEFGKGVGSWIVCLAISLSEFSSSNGKHPHNIKYAIIPIDQQSTDLSYGFSVKTSGAT